jgi:tetratricopeptide (TPR) repeat protein
MSDILEEIREDLYKEKISYFWQKYSLFFFLLIFIIILLSSAYIFYSNYSRNKAFISSEELYNIIDSYNSDLEEDFLDLTNNFPVKSGAIAHIVSLKKAQYYIKKNDIDKSYDLLSSLLTTRNNDKLLNDYSYFLINYIIFRFPDKKFKNKDSFTDIAGDNIFYYPIIEIKALSYIELGKYDLAVNELNKIITATDASQFSKNFASELMDLLERSAKI